ncbi:Integrase core domain-containing protein [Streptoalloteichus tenebrarius]|uniref:Integrase core domain-containing protein n=1 Tax=Streptoalloteichus tenebrarius (strain ATCC 17920 / DSM 40477 / JCM 4838 / CBS 697.72 / NBRC 16177 / NCIMB 11028 / NRRL B-12390 / A12253. 1 / ISP 5477) TaxID=1933 RepID=A0ABT1HUP7_STRSD|nr:Integrase core domain-containing protein [Streptoalloteichus tenebrarius]BFE99004.1 hypothetical protein GCM10020241_06800 [Streptoalloteichus tenebrarius]
MTWFNTHGIVIERVLIDNAWPYAHDIWRDTCDHLGIPRRFTGPWHPETNGEGERFHRALLDEWAYARPTAPRPNDEPSYHGGCTPTVTTAATPHSQANRPASRVPHLSGQYT